MSKNNSKSLASLRQKLRKYNKDFEEELKVFRENPDIVEEDEEQTRGKLLSC
jgi:translation initiation factor 3 subunit C